VTATLLLGAAMLAPAGAASAAPIRSGVNDFRFSSYDADYYLGKDAEGHATLKTVEKLTAVFPQSNKNKGITRAIPDDYNGVPLHTAVVSVSDSEGNTKPYSIDDDGDFTQVALGTDAYVHGSVTYTITYTQQNVAGSFADTGDDEFYWDTNGTGFDQPFARVSGRVHIDPSIVPALTGNTACYQGAENSTTKCSIAQSEDASTTPAGTVFAASANDLKANETMTLAIGFAAGTFVQEPRADAGSGGETGDSTGDDGGNSPSSPLWTNLVGGLLLLLGLGAGAFALVRRFAFGQRDSRGRGVIIPQYSVPQGINLMDAAALVSRKATGISAQIVSFAVRGNLRILDYPVTASDAEYTLQLVHANHVDPDELQLLGILFGTDLKPGAVREMVRDSDLASRVSELGGVVSAGLVTRGFRRAVSSIGGIIIGLAVLVLVIVEIAFSIVAGAFGTYSVFAFLGIFFAVVSMFVAFGVAWRRPTLTDAGAEQRDYLLGMRDYLRLAEADRLRVLQSPQGAERIDVGNGAELVKLYEKLLPFAVLWGVEAEWNKELAIHYEQNAASPDWFVGANGFNASLFSGALAGLSAAIITSSTPPASTSSWSGSGGGSSFGGSMGGGFSGGGGGGGGGGGR
jgi:uncharacterized membrane protein YgcG